MTAPFYMPLHEKVQYYGADSVPIDELIQALWEYHMYAEDDLSVKILKEEIKYLKSRIDELKRDLTDAEDREMEAVSRIQSLEEELFELQTQA